MLRSFDYAAAVRPDASGPLPSWPSWSRRPEAWEAHNRQAFLEGYLGARRDRRSLLPARVGRRRVLIAFELDKALYELDYEQAHRPDWVQHPAGAPSTAWLRRSGE